MRASKLLDGRLDEEQGLLVHGIHRHCEEDTQTAQALRLLMNSGKEYALSRDTPPSQLLSPISIFCYE